MLKVKNVEMVQSVPFSSVDVPTDAAALIEVYTMIEKKCCPQY